MLLKNVNVVVLQAFVSDYCSNNYCASGVTSFFIPINEKIGIKFYRYEESRDICFENQKDLARHELAPNVYGKLPVISILYDGYTNNYYGYLTEIVQVLKKVKYEKEEVRIEEIYNKACRCEVTWTEYLDICDQIMYKKENQRKKLIRKIKEVGYMFYDTHDGNIGVKNGKFVCIDPELGRVSQW